MTKDELIASLSDFFTGFGAELTNTQWSQYHLALAGVNPGDLDDAMGHYFSGFHIIISHAVTRIDGAAS